MCCLLLLKYKEVQALCLLANGRNYNCLLLRKVLPYLAQYQWIPRKLNEDTVVITTLYVYSLKWLYKLCALPREMILIFLIVWVGRNGLRVF